MIKAILEILAALAKLVFGGWKKRNNPSVAQRGEQIAADYQRKREDLRKR